ncbi:secretin and TonB N terminus short domain protein [Burkholderia sp. Ac-20379]|nr:TonB C-terminal domain-containing protein [Burkholderia sp. Ac-20379]MBN3724068.1 secretin and TonB N terminus short domain protein [Burkholderia sp. Ac-20379]
MTRFRAPVGVVALSVCLAVLAWPGCRAMAQTASNEVEQPGGVRHFELPAQPLARALLGFARISELVVLAPAPLLEGRISTPLSGDFQPRDALRRVLAGTGLRADFSQPDEAIIVPDRAPAAAAPEPEPAQADAALPIDGVDGYEERRAYAALIQTKLIEALCAKPGTVPGAYRFAAQVRLDERGAVVAVNQVASSGEAARDAAILRALRVVQIDAVPPDGLPQPVTILLRPVGGGVHFRCPTAASRN